MARTRQYADRVNIIKMIKVDGKWRFAKVVERNGKITRDHVLVSGKDEHHPEGSYYLEWRENGKRRRQPIAMFDEAVSAARTKALELEARKAGILVTLPRATEAVSQPAPVPSTASAEGRLTIGDAVDRYMEFVRRQRSLRTFRTYRVALRNYFLICCERTFLEEVTREDLLQFSNFCFDRGLEACSVSDKLITVATFLKWHGRPRLLERNDWPRYTETIRPVYETEELQAMLRHATPVEAVLIKFFLASGFRNREARFTVWHDIDFRNSLARVTAKPLWKFSPKNYEERAVPLPESMMALLRQLKKDRNAAGADLVFPNTVGKPDTLHIEIIKKVAWRAKLNCGQCVSEHDFRCADGPYCERIFLHKFRHTFATQHLRDGIDIVTLKDWLGHRDIQSTMVYLKGIRSKDALPTFTSGENQPCPLSSLLNRPPFW